MQMQLNFPDYINELYINKYSVTKNNYLKIANSSVSFDEPIIKELLEKCDNKLILMCDTNNLLNKMPHTITKLILALDHYKNVLLDNLPSNITELYITSEFCDLGCKNIFDSSINNLPLQLETLVIDSVIFNHSLDYLPITLKTLKIKSNLFNKSIDNLPPNLEQLELLKAGFPYNPTKNVFTGNLYNLPATLTKLIISIDYTINTNIEQFKSTRPNLLIDIIDKLITIYEPQKTLYGKFIDIGNKYPYTIGICFGFISMCLGFINGKIWSKYLQ